MNQNTLKWSCLAVLLGCGLASSSAEAWQMPPLTTKQIDGVDKIRLLPPGPDNPRNSEGSFIQLKDGRLLFIYTHFTGGKSDHAAAHLAGRFSSDGGLTWTKEDKLILPNQAGMNVMSVSLLRLANGEIALFYLAKESLEDCRPLLRISIDEAETWSDPIQCIAEKGYDVLNNDRVIQLKSGRLVLAIAQHDYSNRKFAARGTIYVHTSDDNGRHWKQHGPVNGGDAVLQEPGLVELKDGRLMMFCRTPHGSQYLSWSSDQGQTWTKFEPSKILSPQSPATIERIPSTGDLLMVWNNHDGIDESLKRFRTPFNTAISRDDGVTWEHVRTLEDDVHGWYCYTAMEFVGDHVVLGHCAGDRRGEGLNTTQITRIPVSWLYGSDKPAEKKP